MALQIPIPKELEHLKVDGRGYPVPYFVTWQDGKPEFRYIDVSRMRMIYERKVCHICGKKLPKDYCYFISGPVGYQNRVSSDAGMHRVCAEFSLRACPHLYLQKAERRENDPMSEKVNASAPGYVIKDKPDTLLLVKVSKYSAMKHENFLLKYTPVSVEYYDYMDGKLTKRAQMREGLKNINGVRKRFIATFERYGSKPAYQGRRMKTLLFVDVRDVHGEKYTDHLWFTANKQFEELNLQPGDNISFDARVKEYKKGYRGRREDYDLPVPSRDYKLSHPNNVVKSGAVGSQGSLF